MMKIMNDFYCFHLHVGTLYRESAEGSRASAV